MKADLIFKNGRVFTAESERMTIEQMLLGYTINGAKQLHLEDRKGSMEAGKDADSLILDKDLLSIPSEGIRNVKPEAVYYCGKIYE